MCDTELKLVYMIRTEQSTRSLQKCVRARAHKYTNFPFGFQLNSVSIDFEKPLYLLFTHTYIHTIPKKWHLHCSRLQVYSLTHRRAVFYRWMNKKFLRNENAHTDMDTQISKLSSMCFVAILIKYINIQ